MTSTPTPLPKKPDNYTVTEILVVIVVLFILAAIIIPQFTEV